MKAQPTSRREVLRRLISGALGAWSAAGRTAWAAMPGGIERRRYRVDASVILFSTPILTRTGVGGAYLAKQQRTREDGHTLLLEFAAGSWPERAHGVRRMGLFQEVQERRQDRPPRAAFFGFMTSSPEKSVVEARRSLTQSNFTHYVGVTGAGSPGRFECHRLEFDLPPDRKWEECAQLASDVRRRLEEPGCAAAEIQTGEPEPNTFLDSVRRAMYGAERHESTFVHNAKRYRLTARRSADSAAALRLAAKGLTPPSALVQGLNATITEIASGSSTPFQVWFDPDDPSGLPLCFEFRPRSFLRLVFEWDRRVTEAPTVSSLFDKEEV